MYGAYRVDTWSGAIQISNVVIHGDETITGVLYKPKWIQEEAPGIVLAHGISNSKEPQTGIALELAKHGYVTLSIDLVGHGRSSGSLDGADQSLGMIQAAQYLADLPFVSENIGLVGHSLGTGAALYASSQVLESGVVLIAGGIGDYFEEPILQPNNLLVIIGQYDVLFDLDNIDERLEATFPENPPMLNEINGDPVQGTMTMLLTPPTSHLLEPLDPSVVTATVDWFNQINDIDFDYSQTYLIREALIMLAFISFIVAIVVGLSLNSEIMAENGFNWRSGLIYGVVGFFSFLPAMLLGNYVPFPPQIFGSSIAWWLFIWGIIMYILCLYWRKTESIPRITQNDLKTAAGVFVACYVYCFGLEYLFGFGYRLMVPIMRTLTLRRAKTLVIYLPFMLGHFYAESIWLRENVNNLRGFAVSKLGLFTAIIVFQYGGFYLLDTVLVGGFIGFILEFLVAIVPMLLISVIITHYGQRINLMGASVVLNALIFSWIAAGLFPY